jgi:hypothetical protein
MTKFHSSLWLNKIPLYINTTFSFFIVVLGGDTLWDLQNPYNVSDMSYHIFLIHSSVFWDLGCFHSLAIVTNAEINTCVPVPLL